MCRLRVSLKPMLVMKCTRSFRCRFVSLLLLGLPFASPGESTNAATDIYGLPLERLLEMEVTTVARKAERLSQSPAAVYVITQDDINRSGATSIPEALRL